MTTHGASRFGDMISIHIEKECGTDGTIVRQLSKPRFDWGY